MQPALVPERSGLLFDPRCSSQLLLPLREGFILLRGLCPISGSIVGLAALVFDVDAALQGFRPFLQFRGNLAHVAGMDDGDSFVGHDGNRQAHHRKLFLVASTIDGIDETLQAIVTVVEIRDDQIETFDDGLADGVDAVQPAHEDEVISPDMADEPLCSGEFSHDRGEDAAGHDEDFVSAPLAVAVGEGFEVFGIGVGTCEGRPALNSGGGFEQDGGVAGEAGEGVGIE